MCMSFSKIEREEIEKKKDVQRRSGEKRVGRCKSHSKKRGKAKSSTLNQKKLDTSGAPCTKRDINKQIDGLS